MFDYIIVGAGSAGCVLANRLSASPGTRVLLLEAGPRDWHPFIHMPAGIAKLVGRKGVNWDYSTEAEPELNNRRLWWPRGKVLGGSSSINAMCYIRGVPGDYNEWAALGAKGWDWASVLPYFKRSEDNQRGASELHGSGGPLGVADLRYHNPLSDQFLAAAAEAGFPRSDDFNGPRQEGFGFYQVTQRDGARCSSAKAYLAPARERPNLCIETSAQATRVLFENGHAVGVEYRQRGRIKQVRCTAEVLLSGGALNSPQLLMLSGIGPADQLGRHGIAVLRDLPGVGQNLQDHLDICSIDRCRESLTYDRTNDVKIALDYYLFKRGPGTSNIAETGGFVRSSLAEDARPDLQFHFVPAILDDHGRNRLPGFGYTVHACALRPKSRGRLELASANPADKVRIFANYLSDAEGYDLAMMVEAVKVSREVLSQPALSKYRAGSLFPGDEARSDQQIIEFVRRKAETIYHPIGTCKMGDDASAVVDSELRVRGVSGLRVIDASVMPKLIGGNTNAPTMMLAERASDLILGHSIDAQPGAPDSSASRAAA
ncbi:GMC family oxidoreductase [Pseudomarimonas arenosa]|uniref:Choline dehydrogenase n=1 Tax=Pseudomarimonas arenosa TaxID=2774145 RepID=A0AAW3ZIA4_9GAMM|nr:choline dehydrogenase [Pseudomarimonas arenosa]